MTTCDNFDLLRVASSALDNCICVSGGQERNLLSKVDDCGSDHELLIAKFRLKLKKAGKTNRLFRYDLNQILMIIQRK